MAKRNQHVVPYKDRWAVRGGGSQKVSSVHRTQKEAISSARNTAIRQRTEVVIHRPNGQIRDRNSYGNDPYPPRG